MNANEIKDLLAKFDEASYNLEELLIENGGEINEEVEGALSYKEDLKELLTTEGIDSLGRWLKSKEDQKAAIKAEKDYLTRKINSIDNNIAYIKAIINQVMTETGIEKIKGTLGYSFVPTISCTTTANKEVLKERYLDTAIQAIHAAGVPSFVGISLTASKTSIAEGEEEQAAAVFETIERPSVRFTKPRASKEE